jgi:ribonuclease HII
MILGIDEAGRGPWAGPLVVGAVVLGCEIDGLNDSKKLTKHRREQLEIEILANAQAVATGWVTAAELDEIGMSEALRLATRRAVEQITVSYHEIIIDGTVNFLRDTAKGRYVTTLPKADALIPSVSAASIIAKVARDRYMTELDATYPEYGFKNHAGYGVARHREAIEKNGVIYEHRLSFAPLQKYRDTEPEQVGIVTKESKTTRSIGDAGENAATEELVRQGHAIIARNWKTKYCEIDIVSRKEDTVYFAEVKHRKNAKHGDGLAAITPRKQQQMTFAARMYAQVHKLTDVNLRLLAIATTGDSPAVELIVEIV